MIKSEIPLYSLSVGEFVKLQKETLSEILCHNDSNIIGITEAAKLTGYSVNTIYSLSSKKLIPHNKPKGRLLFDRDELIQWMKNSSDSNSSFDELNNQLLKRIR